MDIQDIGRDGGEDLHLDECEHLYSGGNWAVRVGHAHEDGFRAGWCAAMRFINSAQAAESAIKQVKDGE